MTAVAFQKNGSTAHHVLQEIWVIVDTKPRGIKVTSIIKVDRGQPV